MLGRLFNMPQVATLALRFAAAALLALLASLMLVGCAQDASSEEGATRTITDVYGRSVEVPETVESVATVGSGAKFVVYAGGQDKLIAVTEMETESSIQRPYTVAWADLFSTLPSTSNGNHLNETNVNTELLLELDPDVIISSRSADECDELQNSIGIPVVGIYYEESMFDENVYNSILTVGQAIGTESHAQSVVDKIMEWEQDLLSRTADIEDDQRPTCYFGAINYRGAKSFSGTYGQYPPAVAVNADNVADEVGTSGSFDIDLEQLSVWDPDYIFVNTANMDLMLSDYNSSPDFFESLTAFQNGNIYSQPAVVYNGMNVEMGICNAYFIGATLYPDAFSDVDLASTYSDILSTMLGVDIYPQLQEAGMDFERVEIPSQE